MKALAIITSLLFIQYSFAQNVGINQNSPTNVLHITPVTIGNDPLRVDGIQAYTVNEDTSLLVINPANGIIRYMNASELSNSIITNSFVTNLGDSLINNSTFISNFGDSLFLSQNFIDSLVSNIYNNGDTLLTNTTFITNLGDTLINNSTFITNLGNTLISNSTFVSNLGDSLFLSQNFIDSLTSNIYNNGDTLLYNANFINNLRDSIDSDVDSVVLNGTTLIIYENGGNVFVDLSSLVDADGDITNELQTISKTGSTVTLSNGGGSFTDTDTQLTEAQVDAFANNNGYLTSFTEVDGSTTNELQNISGSGLSGTTLTIGIQNGSNQTVNLSSLVNDADASTTNELQTLSQSGLNVTLSNGGGTVSINDNDWTILGNNQYSAVSGNVGIGLTNPGYKLHVAGDIYANGGWFRVSGNQGIYFASHGGGFRMVDATWIRTYRNKSFYHNSGHFRTDGILEVGGNGSTFKVTNGGNLAYKTNVLFANTIGRVGIRTTAPTRTLDVNGNVRIRSITATTSTNLAPLYVDGSGNVYKKPVSIGSGPKFITPRIVRNSGASIGYTTFYAASYVPAGATAVILEYQYAINAPDVGDVDAHVYIRKNSSSASYLLTRGRASGGNDDTAAGGQGVFPCSSNRTFQYTTQSPGFNNGLTIRLIGYY